MREDLYRIRLVSTTDPYTDLRPGDEGVVTHEPKGGDRLDTYWVRWDNGSTLGLVPGVDHFERIDQEEVSG